VIRTLEDLRAAPVDAGTARDFTKPFDWVREACEQAVAQAGLTIKETNAVGDSQIVILAEKRVSAWSWGELVRVIVQQSDDERTTVRVLTMRRLALNLTAKGDYSETIFANILSALEKN
jgi:hypothetical protein